MCFKKKSATKERSYEEAYLHSVVKEKNSPGNDI